MFNSDMPNRDELPSTRQLVRSTFIALGVAIAILVTVILPAEYAIDPTGMGKTLGLMEMGEIKSQLAQEAKADQANNNKITNVKVAENNRAKPESSGAVSSIRNDKILLSLKPGQGAEVKLVMDKGQSAQFEWTSKGGAVNYDTHGDGNGNSISYEKGRGVSNDQGELEAAFTGDHGWFFRNRNDNTVMVILRTNGEYTKMKRVL